MILEHATTIEKSMNQIIKLEKDDQGHANQLVRWVMNKERYAALLKKIATQCFMTQRIKAVAVQYDKELAALHGLLVAAMKCMQGLDVIKLRTLTAEFEGCFL